MPYVQEYISLYWATGSIQLQIKKVKFNYEMFVNKNIIIIK